MNDEPFIFLEDTPPHLKELCLACVQYVQRATGIMLDGTPDTLPVLDLYLTTVRNAQPELKSLVVRAAGAYFGEVVRREHPAHWHCPPEAPEEWRIELERCFLYFSPVAFVVEAVEGEDVVEGGAGFGVSTDDLDVIRDAVDLLGEVSHEDYFRLAMRFETLGPVVDRLVARSIAREGQIEFTHEVYQRALDDNEPGA